MRAPNPIQEEEPSWTNHHLKPHLSRPSHWQHFGEVSQIMIYNLLAPLPQFPPLFTESLTFEGTGVSLKGKLPLTTLKIRWNKLTKGRLIREKGINVFSMHREK